MVVIYFQLVSPMQTFDEHFLRLNASLRLPTTQNQQQRPDDLESSDT